MPRVNGLYFRVSGEGQLVMLFLHGAGGYHGVWRYYEQKLNKLAKILLFDLPGHGKSKELPFHSVEESSREIHCAIEKMIRDGIINKVPDVVVGHSLGGMVGLYLVLKWQDVVKTPPKIVLISTPLWLSRENTSHPSLNKDEICERLFYKEEWRKRCQDTRRLPIFADIEVLKLSLASAYEYDFRNFSHLLRAEVHLIFGAHDRVVPIEHFNEVKKFLSSCKIYKINNSGHMPHLEERKKVLRVLCKIIKKDRKEVIR